MKNLPVISVAVATMIAICLAVLRTDRLIGPHNRLPSAPADDELYPRPAQIPDRTSRPLTELLRKYEAAIKELSPSAHATLQPGLSANDLDELEQKYSIVLSPDMRTLYSWKNGSDPSQAIDVFPYMRFVPLEEALEARDHFRDGVKDEPPEIRDVYDNWLSYRYSWVGVIKDAAGGGYFYDPDRRDELSSFFCHSLGDVGYMFYPAIGNYIEELLELHRTAQLSADETGLTLEYDWTYDEERAFLNRFGRWVE